MRQRMRRNLHSRAGYSVEGREMCNVRIPRCQVAIVESRPEKKFETKSGQCNHAHDNSIQKYLIKYIHAAFQLCKIDMHRSNQKWAFHIVARLNRTCCGKTFIQININNQR
jgi:hypothetical protein